MKFMDAGGSPFLVLWYLFLAFFGVALVVHILCKLLALFFKWRVGVLVKIKANEPEVVSPSLSALTESFTESLSDSEPEAEA